MDPLLFSIEADVAGEVIHTLILVSIFVERALSPLFQWRVFLSRFDRKGVKEPIES